ncbi:ThiF family adenylyltransferase [Kineosporia sp. NBRC 101731]|uniref:ThiF family adenylyltransferase n=1 Tax=Kineosporia sp. NBRC 101731 TaxID=3032199 RepID=UPI0024A304FA|nr:ThiF family adenylyltransferase [Kineosporia sp. NBRC 101731]GLY29627.1 molybdopterin biosynthesis protein MoeZ [Kineosporia sp. NBRC 101731]
MTGDVRPPLVAPGGPLTEAEHRRYARHLVLPEVGGTGQRRLKAARVLLVGAGGLGSPSLQYLAAAGVGTIGLVDDDVVEESNLQRQVIHTGADVGRSKVDSAADAVRRANPLVRVERHRERLHTGNAVGLVEQYDLVLDGSDNFPTRYLVNDACVLTGIPWVWAAVLRSQGQASTFWGGHGPQYRDLFPEPPAPGSVPDCNDAGVLGAVCGLFGSIMAAEAVKLITGTGQSLLGRVLTLDVQTWSWRTFRLIPDATRAPITRLAPPTLPMITAGDLAGRLRARAAGDDDFLLIDVREPAEHDRFAIPGALLVPLADLERADLPRDVPLILYCAAGQRSARAIQVLRRQKYSLLHHLDGGIRAWTASVASADGVER